jgi:hypothetical protein
MKTSPLLITTFILLMLGTAASCGYTPQPWEGDRAEAAELEEGATMAALFEAEQAERYATMEAEGRATHEAERFANIDAIVVADQTARAATEVASFATDQARQRRGGLTANLTPTLQRGCPNGCKTKPSWCDPPIKGNVTFDKGERIYHMHGDEFYYNTVINPDYDERYFCTPEEAESAGFRRAYR